MLSPLFKASCAVLAPADAEALLLYFWVFVSSRSSVPRRSGLNSDTDSEVQMFVFFFLSLP